eukprot:TRINITY_DN50174_c0_g1_i1.p1 TRINITY_DN50174_c0_g1~~TRINITY_DN50174_c0_g1_i1.p1  ORF type:complete len:708 (+),score=236.87 TRINITY_DN50174_c0_g1_i1:76-2199(+)
MPPKKQLFADSDSDSDAAEATPKAKPSPAAPANPALSALLEQPPSPDAPAATKPAGAPGVAAKFNDPESDGDSEKDDGEWEPIEASPRQKAASPAARASPPARAQDSDSESLDEGPEWLRGKKLAAPPPAPPPAAAPPAAAPAAAARSPSSSSSDDPSAARAPPLGPRKPAPKKPAAKSRPADDSDSSSSDLIPAAPGGGGGGESAAGVAKVQLREQLAELSALFAGGWQLRRLQERSMRGLRGSRLRSLHWKVCLGMLRSPPEGTSLADAIPLWEQDVAAGRQRFADSLERHTVGAKSVDDDDEEALIADNPLAQGTGGVWDQRFAQKEVEKEITKDLDRMSSEDQLLERSDVRGLIFSVLRAWALDNPDPGYRQGMHDVCSAFCYHIVRDAEPLEGTRGGSGGSDELRLLRAVIPTEQRAKDADCFFLFDTLLTHPNCELRAWYAVTGASPRGASASPVPGGGGGRIEAPIVRMCKRVQDEMLPRRDERLGKHLAKLGIEPTTYGLRWLRLGFIREFDIVKASIIWDAIFAEVLHWTLNECAPAAEGDSPLSRGMLPHVACAMLCFLSQDLLSKEFPMAMRRMMRYPPVEDVGIFVERAAQWSGSPLLPLLGVRPVEPRVERVVAAGYPKPHIPSNASMSGAAPAQRNRQLGERLAKVITTLEQQWFRTDAEQDGDQRERRKEEYLLAVAEAKRIRDELLGGLDE